MVMTKDKPMTISELTQLATEFLRDNFGITLDIPIERNNRLRRVMGRFNSTHNNEPIEIQLAGFLLDHGAPEVIVDTLYHECVHYALCHRGEPYDDGHPIFEAEIKRLGVSASGTNSVGVFVEYNCAGCGDTILTSRKRVLHYPRNYMTKCCDADLTNVRERIYNGMEAIT